MRLFVIARLQSSSHFGWHDGLEVKEGDSLLVPEGDMPDERPISDSELSGKAMRTLVDLAYLFHVR